MNTVVVTVKVVEAEVYRVGCVVTCHGTATLEEGENRLAIEGLPAGLVDGSVSVRMPRVVSLGQVRVVREQRGFRTNKSEGPTELDRKILDINRRISNKELELNAWKGLASKIGGNMALEYLGLYPAKLDELSNEILELREEQRATVRQQEKERENRARPRLEVDVTTTEAGVMPVEIVCRSDEAEWTPSYDVLVDDLENPLKLHLKGFVWQNTGDDWQGITMRLSTGTASVLGDLPRFVPRYLYKVEPWVMPVPTPMPRPYASRKTSVREDRALSAVPMQSPDDTTVFYDFDDVAEDDAPEAEVAEQATVTTYELVGTQTLSTGVDPQMFAVSTTELAASYHLYAYPRRDEAAYLVAHLDDEPAPEVLERPLSVYLEGSYAGTIKVGRATDEHGYELPLGRDNRVRVRRKEDVRRSKKLLGGKVCVEHACAIGIESHTRAPMDIVVIEQVPVSRDKEIEVTLRDGSGASFDKERGELRWEQTLAPGERLDLGATYVISHAKGLSIGESTQKVNGAGSSTFCPMCGSPLAPGLMRCPVCGSPVR